MERAGQIEVMDDSVKEDGQEIPYGDGVGYMGNQLPWGDEGVFQWAESMELWRVSKRGVSKDAGFDWQTHDINLTDIDSAASLRKQGVANPERPVVIKVGHFYIQYNRAFGINAGTQFRPEIKSS